MRLTLRSVTKLFLILAAMAIVLFRVAMDEPVRVSAFAQTSDLKPDRPQQEKRMSEFLGLRTVVYRVNDLARARAWYTEALGVKPYFDQPFYVGFNVGGYELGLVPDAKASMARDSAGIAYWGVTDANSSYARLLKMGATAHQPVEDVGDNILVGAVTDPFGNVFGIIYNPHFKLPPQE